MCTYLLTYAAPPQHTDAFAGDAFAAHRNTATPPQGTAAMHLVRTGDTPEVPEPASANTHVCAHCRHRRATPPASMPQLQPYTYRQAGMRRHACATASYSPTAFFATADASPALAALRSGRTLSSFCLPGFPRPAAAERSKWAHTHTRTHTSSTRCGAVHLTACLPTYPKCSHASSRHALSRAHRHNHAAAHIPSVGGHVGDSRPRPQHCSLGWGRC